MKKESNAIFMHKISHSRMFNVYSEIEILDQEENNLLLKQNEKNADYYTLPKESVEEIKHELENDKLYEDIYTIDPPVLDGYSHKIFISSNNKSKEIECSNLGAWNLKDDYNYINDDFKSNLEYTKEIVKLIYKIQDILNKNNIKYNILQLKID